MLAIGKGDGRSVSIEKIAEYVTVITGTINIANKR